MNTFGGQHPLNPLQAAWFYGTVYAGMWGDSRASSMGAPLNISMGAMGFRPAVCGSGPHRGERERDTRK